MAMLDLIDHRGEFPAHPFIQSDAEKISLMRLAVSRHKEADLATALKYLVDGEVAFEDEVPAVLDLRDGVKAR